MPLKLPESWDVVDVVQTLVKMVEDLEERVLKLEARDTDVTRTDTDGHGRARTKKITT